MHSARGWVDVHEGIRFYQNGKDQENSISDHDHDSQLTRQLPLVEVD